MIDKPTCIVCISFIANRSTFLILFFLLNCFSMLVEAWELHTIGGVSSKSLQPSLQPQDILMNCCYCLHDFIQPPFAFSPSSSLYKHSLTCNAIAEHLKSAITNHQSWLSTVVLVILPKTASSFSSSSCQRHIVGCSIAFGEYICQYWYLYHCYVSCISCIPMYTLSFLKYQFSSKKTELCKKWNYG